MEKRINITLFSNEIWKIYFISHTKCLKLTGPPKMILIKLFINPACGCHLLQDTTRIITTFYTFKKMPQTYSQKHSRSFFFLPESPNFSLICKRKCRYRFRSHLFLLRWLPCFLGFFLQRLLDIANTLARMMTWLPTKGMPSLKNDKNID